MRSCHWQGDRLNNRDGEVYCIRNAIYVYILYVGGRASLLYSSVPSP
jgi:hypothetical protein